MNTKILEVDSNNIAIQVIKEAAEVIKQGGVVAFPTETVYGLGANGLDEEASQKIYSVKGRPSNNPLIFHISDVDQLQDLVEEISFDAKKLINLYWPGPLTLVFKKNKKISKKLTSNLETIAIRMPENVIARKLIKESNVPIVAPSANLSGKPSPTKAEHVSDDLQGKIEIILDGGEVDIGLESTIVDVSTKHPRILRPGKITREELLEVIELEEEKTNNKNDTPKAPGMMYKHYSPDAKVIVVDKDKDHKTIEEEFPHNTIILTYSSLEEMAKNIYGDFREADKQGFETIVVKSIDKKGLGEAIMNRVLKASSKE